MSRKTIQISIPAAGSAPAKPSPTPTRKTAGGDAGADSWVAQAPDAAPPARVEILEPTLSRDEGVHFTVSLSAQPSFFDAAKVFFLLPQAALWFWGLGLVQRTVRGPQIWLP